MNLHPLFTTRRVVRIELEFQSRARTKAEFVREGVESRRRTGLGVTAVLLSPSRGDVWSAKQNTHVLRGRANKNYGRSLPPVEAEARVQMPTRINPGRATEEPPSLPPRPVCSRPDSRRCRGRLRYRKFMSSVADYYPPSVPPPDDGNNDSPLYTTR